MKRNIKTYSQFINEDVRHEGDMWNVYVGKRLVGSYESRKEAREHNNKLKKTKTK
jgi:hypothetical protein